MRLDWDKVARYAFVVGLMLLGFAYGFAAQRWRLFPAPEIEQAKLAAYELVDEVLDRPEWFYRQSAAERTAIVHVPGATAPGLTLISGVGADGNLFARVVDEAGTVVKQWTIDWFALWPNPDHIHPDWQPQSRPGTHIHGIVAMPDGGIAFSFERLGLVRLDACGGVRWRLAYNTHHSLHRDDNGDLWASGLGNRPGAPVPNIRRPYTDSTVVRISPEGEILDEIFVTELLERSGYLGLIYMSTTDNDRTVVGGDIFHLNDVEPFPASLAPGVFRPGDVMISLRNINAVIVFDRKTLRIRHVEIGRMLRQHDPDFLDGNTISVFDNNNLAQTAVRETNAPVPNAGGQPSRIVTFSADDGHIETVYAGSKEQPFFTAIMGKHQWLSNGNLLITESTVGRAFEIDASGRMVWEYVNVVGEGTVGLMDEAQRLPPAYTAAFYRAAEARCGGT